MKKTIACLVFPIALASASVLAVQTVQSLSMTDIVKKLQEAGYGNINEIEYEHGIYKAKVYDQQGHKIKLRIDPQTGKILNAGRYSQAFISMQQALEIATKAGYSNFHKIELEHGYYEIEGINAKGKKVELKIDPVTGNIKSEKAG